MKKAEKWEAPWSAIQPTLECFAHTEVDGSQTMEGNRVTEAEMTPRGPAEGGFLPFLGELPLIYHQVDRCETNSCVSKRFSDRRLCVAEAGGLQPTLLVALQLILNDNGSCAAFSH